MFRGSSLREGNTHRVSTTLLSYCTLFSGPRLICERVAQGRVTANPFCGAQGGLVQELEQRAEPASVVETPANSGDSQGAALVAAAAALALSACGGGEDGGPGSSGSRTPPNSTDAHSTRAGTWPGSSSAAGYRSSNPCRGRPFRTAGPVLGERSRYHLAQERWRSRLARRALQRTARPDWRRLARFARPRRHHCGKALPPAPSPAIT